MPKANIREIQPMKRRSRPNELLDWVAANPTVKRWFDKVAHGAKGSARTYGYYLYPFWRDCVAKRCDNCGYTGKNVPEVVERKILTEDE